jgi:hypothetical protein
VAPPEPIDPGDLAGLWGVSDAPATSPPADLLPGKTVLPLETDDEDDLGGLTIDDSGFDLLLDDDLPLIDPGDGPPVKDE